MKTHIIHCGYLSVEAEKMIQPMTTGRLRAYYDIDVKGYMKLSMNALLVNMGDRVVLMDPGCADFLPARLAGEYGLEILETMEEQLAGVGYNVNDVTDVIFTHLHFDHGSGAFQRVPGNIIKRFPQARYHVLKEHFEYAVKATPKESNTFFTPFLKYLDKIYWLENWKEDWITFKILHGHTRGMVIPVIKTSGRNTCYVTDLIPLELFLESGVHSGYDFDPELAKREKLEFLNELKHTARLILYHDPLKESMFYP